MLVSLYCEDLLRCGIAVMAAAVCLMLVCCAAFLVSGRRLRRQLEEEYGKPYR